MPNSRFVRQESSSLRLLFAGAIIIYVAGYLAWYSLTPLGRYPVLDDREILALAAQYAQGVFAREAFYRAPLYPALLALPIKLGAPLAIMPVIARAFNALCHLTTTYLVWRSVKRITPRPFARVFAASLVGFNPLLLHFCGDALDITAAITALSLSVSAVLAALDDTTKNPRFQWTIASFWLGIGVLFRPQLLSVFPCLPLIARFTAPPTRAKIAAALIPCGLCLFALGAVNYQLAHDFRVLPWQGAYNFWAANRPGAHGRYFEQSVPITSLDSSQNPTRLESEQLYLAQNPTGSSDYRAQTKYWQAHTWAAIRAAPLRWVKLLCSKFFYVMNNVEQYNNKTFSFHRAHSPWLRWNPLCWTLIVIGGVGGILVAVRNSMLRSLALLSATYVGGMLLYFVSDRFRAPLIPLLAIAAAGWWKVDWRNNFPTRAIVICIGLAAVSLYPLNKAELARTEIQDYMAVAKASDALGEYREALNNGAHAVALDPTRIAAQVLMCTIRFNAWLHEVVAPDSALNNSVWASECANAANLSPTAARVLGFLEWRRGARDSARKRWQQLAATRSEETDVALEWLLLTGGVPASSAAIYAAQAETEPVLIARAYLRDERARQLLMQKAPTLNLEREFTAITRLFSATVRDGRANIN
jgi:hypothetical protein